MTKIKADKVLFIKLGRGGIFETECIKNENTLRLGYSEIDHQFCIHGEWGKVHQHFMLEKKSQPFVATSHTHQIKQFYEEGENTLWVTFYANKLWWCFSKPEITLLSDNTKQRPVIGKWSDKDINGNVLLSGNISGKLLKTQGFRGTICNITEKKYVLSKINGEQIKEVFEAEEALNNLKNKL